MSSVQLLLKIADNLTTAVRLCRDSVGNKEYLYYFYVNK